MREKDVRSHFRACRLAGSEATAGGSMPDQVARSGRHRVLRSLLGMRERSARIIRLSERSRVRRQASRRHRGLRLSVAGELL